MTKNALEQRKAKVKGGRLEAAKNGLRRFLASPCRVCGGLERYTSSGACTACTDRRSTARAKTIKELLQRNGT